MNYKFKITDPLFPECPVRNVLSRIGEKWPLLIMLALDAAGRPMRYSDLQRAIPDISQKMLSQHLRDLEADGFIIRTAYAEVPPRVEYSFTERARTLMPMLHNLVEWALANISGIINDRTAYYETHPKRR